MVKSRLPALITNTSLSENLCGQRYGPPHGNTWLRRSFCPIPCSENDSRVDGEPGEDHECEMTRAPSHPLLPSGRDLQWDTHLKWCRHSHRAWLSQG